MLFRHPAIDSFSYTHYVLVCVYMLIAKAVKLKKKKRLSKIHLKPACCMTSLLK